MPEILEDKIKKLKPGDTAEIGSRKFALTDDGAGLTMQQVGVVEKTFQIGGMIAARAKAAAELEFWDEMIAKHAELSNR